MTESLNNPDYGLMETNIKSLIDSKYLIAYILLT